MTLASPEIWVVTSQLETQRLYVRQSSFQHSSEFPRIRRLPGLTEGWAMNCDTSRLPACVIVSHYDEMS